MSIFLFAITFLKVFIATLGIHAGTIAISGGFIVAAICSIFFVKNVNKIKIYKLLLFSKDDFYYIISQYRKYKKQ